MIARVIGALPLVVAKWLRVSMESGIVLGT
jgi:hypothetical protein